VLQGGVLRLGFATAAVHSRRRQGGAGGGNGIVVATGFRHPERPLHYGCGMIGFHHGAALGTAQVENVIFIVNVKLY